MFIYKVGLQKGLPID